jgi:hypothetical protein
MATLTLEEDRVLVFEYSGEGANSHPPPAGTTLRSVAGTPHPSGRTGAMRGLTPARSRSSRNALRYGIVPLPDALAAAAAPRNASLLDYASLPRPSGQIKADLPVKLTRIDRSFSTGFGGQIEAD